MAFLTVSQEPDIQLPGTHLLEGFSFAVATQPVSTLPAPKFL